MIPIEEKERQWDYLAVKKNISALLHGITSKY